MIAESQQVVIMRSCVAKFHHLRLLLLMVINHQYTSHDGYTVLKYMLNDVC